jgi:biotin transport system substrate-specific component
MLTKITKRADRESKMLTKYLYTVNNFPFLVFMLQVRARSRVVALSSLFAALTAIGAWISIPVLLVPMTLQTFFVYLSVLVLKRNAFISQAVYILMGLAGLPVFSKGMSGYGALLGPTGGYILGFLVGSFVSGLFLESLDKKKLSKPVSLVICVSIIFGMGWAGLSYWLRGDFNLAFWSGVAPFLPGDALKAALALILAKRIAA